MAMKRKPNRTARYTPGIVNPAHAPPITNVRRRVVSKRSAACSTAKWRASTSSIMAASSGAEPMASASDVRSPSACRSAVAAAHTRRWSSDARISTAWPRCELAARSAAPKRMSRRAPRESTSSLVRRLQSPSASVNSAVTSPARSTSTIRWRPVVGRNTARGGDLGDPRSPRWRPVGCRPGHR